jgi:hypothetical protein
MFVGAPTHGSPPNTTLDAGTVQLAWPTHAAATTEADVLLLHAPVLKPVSQSPAGDPYEAKTTPVKRPPSQRSVRLAPSPTLPHMPLKMPNCEAHGHIVARARERSRSAVIA